MHDTTCCSVVNLHEHHSARRHIVSTSEAGSCKGTCSAYRAIRHGVRHVPAAKLHAASSADTTSSVWRHAMCKNSTAGTLAANCGHTYVGEPYPEGSDHTATVFWFHGLGDSGQKWSTITREMKMPWVRFIFPSAPVRRTRLRLRPTAAWFNVLSLSPEEEEEDVEGILEAAEYVNALVDAEIARGIPPERIALVGFSMGGATVLSAGLQVCVRERVLVGGQCERVLGGRGAAGQVTRCT